ncbi:MAG: MFS transporter, partial [Rhizobiaceae bacterium]|nr:MFS transporter [Rhizobiaceae bacterium]
VSEVWQFYAVWIAIGMMISGCLYEPCFAIITRARGPAGRRAIITITLMAGFASTISFPLANTLAEANGWRFSVLVFCGIAVLFAAPLNYLGAKSVEEDPWEEANLNHNKSEINTSKAFLRQPQFWCLGLGFACGAMLQQMTVNHLLAILADRNVLKDVAILAASFIGPMQVAGRIAMVAAGERASNHLVAICSFFAMGVSAVMLMLAGYSPGFIAAFAIFFGAAHGVVSIIRPGLAWEILGGENYGAKSGMLASFFFIGGAIAPFTGSLIWQAGGYDTVLVFLMFLASAGLLLYLAAQKFAKISSNG